MSLISDESPNTFKIFGSVSRWKAFMPTKKSSKLAVFNFNIDCQSVSSVLSLDYFQVCFTFFSPTSSLQRTRQYILTRIDGCHRYVSELKRLLNVLRSDQTERQLRSRNSVYVSPLLAKTSDPEFMVIQLHCCYSKKNILTAIKYQIIPVRSMSAP